MFKCYPYFLCTAWLQRFAVDCLEVVRQRLVLPPMEGIPVMANTAAASSYQ